MTFINEETSREQGSPVELYTIEQGSEVFRYTTGEETLILTGDTFSAEEISRSAILAGPENRTQTLEVTLKSNNEFASLFIGIQPSNKATVTIERFHRFDSAAPDERVQLFKGQVRSVAFVNDGFESKLSLMPLTGSLTKTIPLYTFQSPCNNVLYDSRCQVLETSFRFQGTVSAVSVDGLTLTVPGLDAAKSIGFATGGRVVLVSNSEPRLILAHTAVDQIKVLLPFKNSPVGDNVNVFAGCDHSLPVCKSKFNNVVNFAGHAFVPTRNPFETGIDQ